jgi:hypothetical protein
MLSYQDISRALALAQTLPLSITAPSHRYVGGDEVNGCLAMPGVLGT